MPNPIVHWEIGARDAQKLQDFYSKLFDWNIETDSAIHYRMVKPGEGPNGGIFQAADNISGEEKQSYLTIYVRVDDLQKYLAKAESLGGKTVVHPTEIPNTGRFAMFTDPEGNLIGLFSSH